MRNWDDDKIWTEFLGSYNENPLLSIVWLFFARDVRGGNGERRTFRVIFNRLAHENPDLAIKLIPLIPEYGRWDDVVEVFSGEVPCKVRDEAYYAIWQQINSDLANEKDGKPISLLAKWMPSLTTSSAKTRIKAEQLRCALNMSPKAYRKMLSRMRRYIDVLEQRMSGNDWNGIDYNAVPSKAGMNYRDAFLRHDKERYEQYLEDVKSGKAKMNADVLFPYEIVHNYMDEYGWNVKSMDETLELKWKNLPNKVHNDAGTLVVVDGSGSMGSVVGNSGVTCHDVARSLGIYFAERLSGPFANSFITFSANPKLVRFDGVDSLNGKLGILVHEDECSNTNIEKTFDLILRTAIENHMTQDDLPKNILICSDMEFDQATWIGGYDWLWGNREARSVDRSLFDDISDRLSLIHI